MATTVTTATAAASASSSLAIVSILTLLVLLILKEIASGLHDAYAQRLSDALNISILPLIVIFVSCFVVRVIEVLH